MKKLLALTAMLASVAAMSGPALAVTGNAYGSVKLQWNVIASLSAIIHTNYSNAGAFQAATATEGASGGAACTPAVGSTDLVVDYGNVTPNTASWSSCNYENAIATSVQTNDNAGFAVKEVIDATNADGAVFCAFSNQPAAFGGADNTTATVTQSTRTGGSIPTSYTGAACAAGGTVIPVGAGGALTNGGAGQVSPQGTIATAYTGEFYSAATNSVTWFTDAGAAGVPVLGGEDLQLNLPTTATSGAENVIMTIQYVAN